MATDGLWDEISRKTSAKLASKLLEESGKKDNFKQAILEELCEKALTNAAKTVGITLDQLSRVNPGEMRREIVDDITVCVVDLSNQV